MTGAVIAEPLARAYLPVQTHADMPEADTTSLAQLLIHDLKAPLVALQWQVQKLQATTRAGVVEPNALQHALDLVRASAVEAMYGLDELQNLMLSQGGGLHLDCVSIEFTAFIRSVVSAWPTQKRHAIRVLTPDDPLTVNVDPLRLRRVINNLLDNAMKYSPSGGLIEVTLDREARNGRNFARLAVSDTGMGIPAHELEHVFEPFWRGRAVRVISGHGLGLSTVKEFVRAHEGMIELQSEVGRGTTFVVLIPLVESASDEVASAPGRSV